MPNVLDRALAWLSPTWGLTRAKARTRLELSSRAGWRRDRTRLISTPSSGGADYHLESSYDRRGMVDKARELVRENTYAEALIGRHAELIVGKTGINPRSVHPDQAVREKQDALWRIFCEPENCTTRRMASWPELQRLLVRSRCTDGDVGVIRRSTGRIQVFHSDELASPEGLEWDPMFRDGVELGADGQPIAFHIAITDSMRSPNRRYSSKRIRVPKRHAEFLPRRLSEDQTRGLPVFAQNFHLFEHLDKLVEAVVVGARMAACYGLVVTTDLGTPDTGQYEAGGDGINRQLEKFFPGMVHYLEDGETLDQLNPNQSLEKLQESIRPILRAVGLPLGLPLEIMLLDMQKMNYTVARSTMIQVYRVIGPEQQYLINHLCAPTWRWQTLRNIASGELPPDPELLKADYSLPVQQLVDPLKDLQAWALALDMGLDDEDNLAKSLGLNLDVILEKRKEILEKKRALGLPVVLSTQTRDEGSGQAEEDDNAESTEDEDEDDENTESDEDEEQDDDE